MARSRSVLCLVFAATFAATLSAQPPAAPAVDYARDIQPLLRQNCVACHGPSIQNGGLRLDRRSSVLKANSRRIVPGSSENSFVFHRVSGTNYGPQMPPTGELKPDQIALIRRWIDQGAPWPDALANEVDLPPFDPAAVALVEDLRTGNLAAFLKTVTASPALLNARGPEGSTPFMYAVLYTGPVTLTRLLALGADPNRHNDANATALMWAAHDLAKTKLLLDHNAEVNVRSDDFHTPLMIASRQPGGAPIVKLLLDHGANPNPNSRPESASSPLLEAATAGEAANFELLLTHGALLKADTQEVLSVAVYSNCARCVDLIFARVTDKGIFSGSLQDTAYLGDTRSLTYMLDHGADPKAFDPLGRTALMYAAASDILPLDSVKLLVAHGADVNARSKHTNAGDAGLSVLDMAMRHGDTPVSRFLIASGAKETVATRVALNPRFKNEIRSAIQDSIPLLQRADANFSAKSGCLSCHNNSLASMTMPLARRQGFQVDEKSDATQVKINVAFLAKTRDQLHQGFLIPVEDNFSEGIVGYMLLGLAAEGYKPDLTTDSAAIHILWRQNADGSWPAAPADTRQPICLMHIGQTAVAMRSLQLYAPKPMAAASRRAVQLAAQWLATAKTYSNDDRSWLVSGLVWAGTDKPALQKAVQDLLAHQKPDGGWSDLPSMESTAYATGKSLVALHDAGLPTSSPAWKRGVQWLLANQQQDGSWYVQTRSLAFQPAFDAGFPHGHNQWISAAGTNWAAMALTLALPDPKAAVASRIP